MDLFFTTILSLPAATLTSFTLFVSSLALSCTALNAHLLRAPSLWRTLNRRHLACLYALCATLSARNLADYDHQDGSDRIG